MGEPLLAAPPAPINNIAHLLLLSEQTTDLIVVDLGARIRPSSLTNLLAIIRQPV